MLFLRLLYTVLVGLFTASSITSIGIQPLAFIVVGLFGIGVSTLHLGKKKRAYRAFVNWRTSWISREILFISAFIGLTTYSLFFPPGIIAFDWVAVIADWTALVSIDAVYMIVPRRTK